MNIKSEEAYRLTRELANATGESLTMAVTVAVRERLARLPSKKPVKMSERLMAIADDTAQRLVGLPNHDELLYGADGLPK
jgi:antitoxin VapB